MQEPLQLNVPGNVVYLSFNPTSRYTLPLPSGRAFGKGGWTATLFFWRRTCHVVRGSERTVTPAGWMATAWDPWMGNLMARRITQPKSHHSHSRPLFSFFSLFSSLSRELMHTNTFQSRWDMTADQCEHSQPHKWKSLICHSSIRVAFLFLSLRGEWTQFGWRPSLLIAHRPKARRLENIFCVCDKAQNHFLFVCDYSFLFLTFMSDTMFQNGFLFSSPFWTDNIAPF